MGSDLIDRQAAIDALYNVDEYNSRSVTAIKNLPSVHSEIIRCGQCKYAKVADSEDSQDGYTCQFHRGSIWFSGSFCSWAEKRIYE